MPIAAVNGLSLYFERAGAGEPLLFISGTGGDLRTNPNQFDGPFPKAFDMISHDQRGLGRSDKPDVRYSMADYADDAAALMASQGWDSAHVVGVSFGGMVAQELALRHPQLFKTVSAFAPISSPTRCPWGRKALGAYLGPDEAAWTAHDSALMIAAGKARGREILVDQGGGDGFLAEQLKPELLQSAAAEGGAALTLRMQEGYDHSYFFITSFIDDHIAWHAERLAEM